MEKHEHKDGHKRGKVTFAEVLTGIKPKHEEHKDIPNSPGVSIASVDYSQSTFSKIFNVVVRVLTVAIFGYVIWYYILPLIR